MSLKATDKRFAEPHEMADTTVETFIGPGHNIVAKDNAKGDGVALRLTRPKGRALYETYDWTHEEAEAMLQTLMDAVG